MVGGDVAGFPNGRRVTDDVVTIELQALAGATIPLVDKTFTPDKAIADVSDGVTGGGLTLPVELPLPRHALQRVQHSKLIDVASTRDKGAVHVYR